jgi:trimeric autotransporter adhesin
MYKNLNRITSWRLVSFVSFLLLNSYAYNQTTIGDCNTGGATATGGFTDFTDADNNYSQGSTTISPSVTNQTITSYHLVNSGNTGSIGFDISHHSANTLSGQTGCITNSERTAVLYPVGGCGGTAISPTTGANNNTFYNPEFIGLTSNTNYILVITTTSVTNCNIDEMWVTYYSIASSSCSATIGTFSMQLNGSSTSNASSYDLLPNETFTITANNDAVLPPTGVDGDQSGVGYAAFSCDPSGYALGDPGKYNTTDMPCFLGFHYSPSMTDANNTSSQVNGLNLTSWWFVPLTFDDVCSSTKSSSPCPGGNSTSIGIDTDGDACLAYGSAIQINYTTPSCGTCTNPACPIYLTPSGGASPSGTYPNSNHITENAVGPATVTECHLVTVTSTNQRLGFRQGIFQANNGCATRTYELKATDANGHCTGSAIPKSQDGSYSVIFNPEWDNLLPGDYIMCITQTLGVGCDIDYINTGYYLENLPTPPCPSDLTFIELDWTQNTNPFVPFPSTTYTCSDGPQTIWKNIEAATIATYGELQAFPGFIMDFVNSTNSPTRTSIAVSVNGTPYSYYGPSDPGGVLYWGTVSSDPYSVLEPYIPAGANVTITICDTRNAAQSFPYIIWDYSTGSVLASGTATPSNGNCTTITFTLAAPTMSWDIDGSTALITDNNNGSATFDPTALSSGSHTITYTYNNNNGCTITATQNITVGPTTPAPTVSNISYCQNDVAVPLTATGSNLLWYTTATGGTGTATAPTPSTTTVTTLSYWVTQTSGGCESPRTQLDVDITATETPTVTCGASTSSSVEFNWVALTGATNYAITYTVNGGASQSGGSTATPTFSLSSLNPGDAVVITIVTTGTGCYANGTGSCTAQACTAAPSITTQPAAQSACEGQTATFSVTATGASGYQWEISTDGGSTFTTLNDGGVYTGATTATLSISDNTGLDANQYRVVVAESNALCPTTSNAALLTEYPTPIITGNSIVCSNATISLTSSTSANTWSSSNTGIISIDNSGLVTGISQGVSTITLTDINTCQQTKTITVPVDQTPTITCGIASEDSVEFNWTIPNGATSYDLSYSVMGGTTISILNHNTNRLGVNGLSVGDTVTLNITTNGTGCYVDNSTFCHTSCTPPEASFLPSPSKMNTLNTTTTMINSSSNATSYFWDFGDGETSILQNPSKTYPDIDTATYLVTLTASNGSCTDVATYYIKIFEDLVYYIPNTFTPDDNDWNQQFKPIFKSGYDTGNYQIQIFNRWGNLIFVSTDINIGWDGKDQGSGKSCEDGTYIWKIEFGVKGIDKRELINGHVNLLK